MVARAVAVTDTNDTLAPVLNIGKKKAPPLKVVKLKRPVRNTNQISTSPVSSKGVFSQDDQLLDIKILTQSSREEKEKV